MTTPRGNRPRPFAAAALALGLAAGGAALATADAHATDPRSVQAATLQDAIARLERLRETARARGSVPVIVRFAEVGAPLAQLPTTAVQERRAEMRTLGSRLLADLAGWGRMERVKRFELTPYVAMHVDEPSLEALSRHPMVLDIAEDRPMPLALAQSAPLVHADTGAWAGGWTGAGQAVAVLDTGVDRSHPFLAGKVVAEACFSTTSTGARSQSLCPGGAESAVGADSGAHCAAIDGCDHGTHVAGIAVGRDPGGPGATAFSGVAPDASLVAVQVFSRFDGYFHCGASSPCILAWTSDQKLALQHVYALRSEFPIAAVNMSLGGDRSDAHCDDSPLKPDIDNLRAAGIAVVIAAGNDGYTDALAVPACVSSAVSVGASCDGVSRYCGAADDVAAFSNVASFVSLVAPGSAITSSVPGGYQAWHGTSMAAPHVSGAWALRKQQSPGATVAEVLADLRSTATIVPDRRQGGTTTDLRRLQLAMVAGGAPSQESLPVTPSPSPAESQTPEPPAPTEPTTPPAAPAAPDGLVARALAGGRIELRWTDNAGDESGFRVERSTTRTRWTVIANLPANTTLHTDGRLRRGRTYQYRVRAWNDAGSSAYTAVAAATALR